jgi:cytochrome c-type biogenesis protein CcmF
MIPELGNFALVLALCLALVQAVLPIAGAHTGRKAWMSLARPAAAGQFVFVALAFAVLVHAFLTDDFSVRFVAEHSNSSLPTIYKFAAAWGGHEGSMLLWILILAVWTLAVAATNRSQPLQFSSRVLGVLGIVSAGVIAFTLFTSNPFDRLLPAAFDGNDLNPLLQDPAMAAHPPMLYLGYVGMSVPFAFAVAALLAGRLDRDWARWTRPWTIMAWVFLTCGITLGSWWSYYELGWGGWWAWDPVENSSFMPWLMGTALVHSLAVTERRGIFKSWTVLLAIAAFSLSLLGTFLTRSGVEISVHAFASDPRRGLFILGLLAVISGGALTLYAVRARHLVAEGGFRLLSREAFLLANNILLVIACGAILFGTLYPLFIDALNLGKISVGPPYFNPVFLLPMLPLLLLLGVGMHTAWRKTNAALLKRRLLWPAAIALVVGSTLPWLLYGHASLLATVGVVAAVWVAAAALLDPVAAWLSRAPQARVSRGQWGMIVAHFGLAIFVLGITVTSAYSVEADRSVAPGDSWQMGGYQFVFRGMHKVQGPNYTADEGAFELRRGGKLLTVLRPQKRTYEVQKSPMTEAAVDAGLFRDIYFALGQPVDSNGAKQAWSVRVQVKPMLSFLWLGALVMAGGGLLAASDRRYRQALRAGEGAAVEGSTQGAA